MKRIINNMQMDNNEATWDEIILVSVKAFALWVVAAIMSETTHVVIGNVISIVTLFWVCFKFYRDIMNHKKNKVE